MWDGLAVRLGRRRFNPFDPIQDTERAIGQRSSGRSRRVSTHSIRYRILKAPGLTSGRGGGQRFNPFDPIQDTESGRITLLCALHTSFNPFDPIQDTERSSLSATFANTRCFNPFDPIQDTERVWRADEASGEARFQPIRSDTGY